MARTGIHRAQPATAAATTLHLPLVAIAALATTLMLEATRVFLSYMVFVIDQSERATLGWIALGVVLAFGLAFIPVRLFGTKRAIFLASGGLVLFRVVLQFWEMPEARLWLGAAAVICWGWLMPPLLMRDRTAAATGVGAGLALDLAIRIAFLSVDLPWMPTATRDGVTILLGLALVFALARVAVATLPEASTAGYRGAIALSAVGPGLAVYHLTTGNLGLAQVKTDFSFPWASALLAAGVAIGLSVPWYFGADKLGERALFARLTVALLTAGGLWLFWHETALSSAGLVAGVAGVTILLSAILGGSGEVRDGRGAGSFTLWLTVGMILHTGMLFAYFSLTGEPLLVAVAVGLLVVGALAPVRRPRGTPVHIPQIAAQPVAVAGIVLLAACVWQFVSWSEAEPGSPLGSNVTAMTYNIQTGFSVDNDWSLEATARTIEAQDPDVVVLQEVSRGWLVTSGVDEVLWLSDRLDMPFVFGASAGDGLWGNAILSRAPIDSSAVHQYGTTENLERGAIEVELRTEAGSLWVFGTHLDNPSGAGEVRLRQTNRLIGFAEDRSPALIAGDFNALPESDVIAAFAAAGFVDPGLVLGPEAFTSQNGNRIDYILVTPDITVREVRIPDVWTSDHKPVAADLTLPTVGAE
ncbi:MAG: endonuclease/exonuclease/phosphatase family protein [Thermomicrobiales bacterium]